MQSASDSPSSQFAQVVAKPPPEWGVPGHQKVVARE